MSDDSPKRLLSTGPIPPYGFVQKDKDEHTKNEWLKDDIKRLEERKVGMDVFEQKEESNTQRFEIIEKRVDKLRGCSRNEEFEDMKKDIAGWRTFFRNTVAVGAFGCLSIVAGWLWQYYTLLDSVETARETISNVTSEVKELSKEIQTHKENSVTTQAEQKVNLEVRFNEMEYRLMLAMSRISQGQHLDKPSPAAYLKARKEQLSQSTTGDAAPASDDATLKQDLKEITASVPSGTEPRKATGRNQ